MVNKCKKTSSFFKKVRFSLSILVEPLRMKRCMRFVIFGSEIS